MTGRLLSIVALAALAGCASQPEATTGPAATPAPATAAVAVPPAEAPPSESAPDANAVAKIPYPGWNKRNRSGQTVYCRRMAVTGSLFQQEVCLTPEKLEQALAQQKANVKRTLGNPTACQAQGEGCQ